jgi:hypothetical protein
MDHAASNSAADHKIVAFENVDNPGDMHKVLTHIPLGGGPAPEYFSGAVREIVVRLVCSSKVLRSPEALLEFARFSRLEG